LKLPEASSGPSTVPGSEKTPEAKLNTVIAITAKGFSVQNTIKAEEEAKRQGAAAAPSPDSAEIPLRNGTHDYDKLQKLLLELKRRALVRILRTADPGIADDADIYRLQSVYEQNREGFSAVPVFTDHEDLKIVAQDSIKYRVVISTMDAARGFSGPKGSVSMFPNVSIAGGIRY